MHLIYKYAFAYYWLQSKVNIIIDLIANQEYKDIRIQFILTVIVYLLVRGLHWILPFYFF